MVNRNVCVRIQTVNLTNFRRVLLFAILSAVFALSVPAQEIFYSSKTLPIKLPAEAALAVDSDGKIYFDPQAYQGEVEVATPSNGSYTITSLPATQYEFAYPTGAVTLSENGTAKEFVWFTGYASDGGYINITCCFGIVGFAAVNGAAIADPTIQDPLPVPSTYEQGNSIGYDWMPGPVGVSSAGNLAVVLNEYDGSLWAFFRSCNLENTSCGWGGGYTKIDTLPGFVDLQSPLDRPYSDLSMAIDSNNNAYITVTSPEPEVIEEVFNSSTGTYSRKTIPVAGLGSSSANQVQVDHNGDLYVSDFENSVIYMLELSSSGSYTQYTVGACAKPYGIALDGNDNVFCSPESADVIEFSPTRLHPSVR